MLDIIPSDPHLISQGPQGHVRSLRHVEELPLGRLGEGAAEYRPQLAQLAEHGRLAATVRSAHQHVDTGPADKVKYQYLLWA